MALASDVRQLLDRLEKLHPPITSLPVEEARKIREALYPELWGEKEVVANVEDWFIPGTAGQIQVRVYQPATNAPLPMLVYFHGGGWVTCSLNAYDGLCRAIANRANCVVASVNYRLAPEHKFPAGVEDASLGVGASVHNSFIRRATDSLLFGNRRFADRDHRAHCH